MTSDDRLALLDSFARAPALLSAVLRRLPKKMWLFRPLPERWSTHEIILHLADNEAIAFVRCRQFVADPDCSIPELNNSKWVANLGYFHQSTREALETIHLLRKMTFELLRSVSPAVWSREVKHSACGMRSLESYLRRQERHIPHHINHIRQNYEMWLAKNPPRVRVPRSDQTDAVSSQETLSMAAD